MSPSGKGRKGHLIDLKVEYRSHFGTASGEYPRGYSTGDFGGIPQGMPLGKPLGYPRGTPQRPPGRPSADRGTIIESSGWGQHGPLDAQGHRECVMCCSGENPDPRTNPLLPSNKLPPPRILVLILQGPSNSFGHVPLWYDFTWCSVFSLRAQDCELHALGALDSMYTVG